MKRMKNLNKSKSTRKFLIKTHKIRNETVRWRIAYPLCLNSKKHKYCHAWMEAEEPERNVRPRRPRRSTLRWPWHKRGEWKTEGRVSQHAYRSNANTAQTIIQPHGFHRDFLSLCLSVFSSIFLLRPSGALCCQHQRFLPGNWWV